MLLSSVFTDLYSGPDPNEVQNAKELCESLLENVKEQYARFKENPPQQRGYGYQQGGQQGGDRQQGYGGGYGSYGGAQSPAAATPVTPGPPGASSPTDYSAQYAQYYGGQDPYAAYGGYQNYVAYYQYYTQQAAQQQGAGAAPGSAPPAPPADDAPPPPPPSGSPPAVNGGYNSVSLCWPPRNRSEPYGELLLLTQGFIGAPSPRNVKCTSQGEHETVEGTVNGGLFFLVKRFLNFVSFCIGTLSEMVFLSHRHQKYRLQSQGGHSCQEAEKRRKSSL